MECRPSNERLIFGWEELVAIDMSPSSITMLDNQQSDIRMSTGEMGTNDRMLFGRDREGKKV